MSIRFAWSEGLQEEGGKFFHGMLLCAQEKEMLWLVVMLVLIPRVLGRSAE